MIEDGSGRKSHLGGTESNRLWRETSHQGHAYTYWRFIGALADGMTVQEVADTYGIPTEAVEGALAFVAEQIADALMQPAKDVPLEQDVRRLLRTLAKRWL